MCDDSLTSGSSITHWLQHNTLDTKFLNLTVTLKYPCCACSYLVPGVTGRLLHQDLQGESNSLHAVDLHVMVTWMIENCC